MRLINTILRTSDQFYFFKKFPVLKQLLKFFLVGISNTAIDFIVYIALTRIFHLYYLIAATISFVMAVTWSFNLNRRWTFKVKRGLVAQYCVFLLINTIVTLLNVSILYLLVDYFEVYDLLAKLVLTFFLGILNFTVNKFLTFRPKIEKII